MPQRDAKKSGYLGVDLGTSGIKIVEVVARGGRAYLSTYGIVEEEINLLDMDERKAAEVGKLLRELVVYTHATSHRALSALPNYTVFSSIISLPHLSKRELERAVQWEAKKLIPTPLEDVVLDWKVLLGVPTLKDGKPRSAKVLITAAPRKLIATFLGIFKAAGLDLVSLETESFSIIRSLIGHEKSGALIVDLGASSTEVTAAAFGVPVVNRSVKFAGGELSRMLALALGVLPPVAEQFKRDLSVANASLANLPPFVEPFSTLLNELRFVEDSFVREMEDFGGGVRIEKVVLTGGQAYLPGLASELSTVLGSRAFVGNPFAHTVYPKEMEETLQDAAPRFGVAVGLGMKNII